MWAGCSALTSIWSGRSCHGGGLDLRSPSLHQQIPYHQLQAKITALWDTDAAFKHLSQFYFTPFIISGGVTMEVLVSLQLKPWPWLQHHLTAKEMKWEKAGLTAGWATRDVGRWPLSSQKSIKGWTESGKLWLLSPSSLKTWEITCKALLVTRGDGEGVQRLQPLYIPSSFLKHETALSRLKLAAEASHACWFWLEDLRAIQQSI